MPTETRAVDPAFMDLALELATRSRPSPNPRVGAVLVRAGEIVGRGHHAAPGEPHAERNAIEQAGGAAAGADLYVTLEPCCHHGRTGPCTEEIHGAGVRRVIVGIVDPDARVRGRGIARLEALGHEVVVGVRGDQCRELLAGYWMHRMHDRPLVTLKAAIALDGRLATAAGESRWISGAASRTRAHGLRAVSDAVLVGIGTVLADDPLLTVRHAPGRSPLRVVLDSGLRTPAGSRLVATAGEVPVLIAHTARAGPSGRDLSDREGVELLECPAADLGRVDLAWLAARLAERGVLSLLVEGGSAVHGAFVAAGLADRAALFVAPRLLGSGPSWLSFEGVRTPADGPLLDFGEPERVEGDLFLQARFEASPIRELLGQEAAAALSRAAQQ